MADGFDKLRKNADRLSKGTNVPLGDLLTPSFMQANTKFPNLNAFLDAANITAKDASSEQVAAALKEKRPELDAFTKSNSTFPTWDAMLGRAGAEYAKRELLRGLK